jgi:hypothetical protein
MSTELALQRAIKTLEAIASKVPHSYTHATIANEALEEIKKLQEDAVVFTPVPMICVTVGSNMCIVGMFSDSEQAQEWATENYFGQWLMTGRIVLVPPPFTKEQIEQAEKNAKELAAVFAEIKTHPQEEDGEPPIPIPHV